VGSVGDHVDLVERPVSQPRNPEAGKFTGEESGAEGDGGSVILPVVLMGDRGLPKGEMVRSGWGGVLKGARDSIV